MRPARAEHRACGAASGASAPEANAAGATPRRARIRSLADQPISSPDSSGCDGFDGVVGVWGCASGVLCVALRMGLKCSGLEIAWYCDSYHIATPTSSSTATTAHQVDVFFGPFESFGCIGLFTSDLLPRT